MGEETGVDGAGDARGEHDRPFDPGLQPERTALSWRRTGLALAVASVAGVRVIPERLGAWALLPTCAGLVLSIAVIVVAHVRYRTVHRILVAAGRDGRVPLAGGGLVALVAAAVLILGLASAAFVLVR